MPDCFFQNCIYVEIDISVCFQSELCFKQNGCGDSNICQPSHSDDANVTSVSGNQVVEAESNHIISGWLTGSQDVHTPHLRGSPKSRQ